MTQLVGDRYRLVRALGEGAGGQVWLAEDRTSRGGEVALKLFEHARGGARERARREFLILSTLRHPALARARDYGETADGWWFTSEHIDGEPLDRWFESAARTPAAALRVASDVLSALDALHSAGLTHGDVRPGNILVARGAARLIDVGLAGEATVREDLKQFGRIFRQCAGSRVESHEKLGGLLDRLTTDAPGRSLPDAATALAYLEVPSQRSAAFVGRESELKRLMAAPLTLLHGEEGCGKTALLEQMRVHAQLAGRIVGIARPHPRSVETMRRLFTELAPAGVSDRVFHVRHKNAVEMRMAASEQLLEAARRMPILIIVEDLHELDADSFGLAVHFADMLRLTPGSQAQVVLTWRDAELAARGRTVEIPEAQVMRLGPLDAAAVAAQRLGGTPSATLVAQLRKATDGNARLLQEALDRSEAFAEVDGAWEAVRSLEGRPGEGYDSLPAPERQLAEVLACSIIPLTREALKRIVRPEGLDSALEGLTRLGWVRVADGYAIASRAKRQAVPEAARERWHQAIAFALETFGGRPPTERRRAMSHHYLAAGQAAKGLQHGRLAAAALLRRHSASEAAEIYERCAAVSPPADRQGLLEQACDAWHKSGDLRRRATAAKRLAEHAKDWRSRFILGEALRDCGDQVEAIAAFRDAADATRDRERRAMALAEAAAVIGLRRNEPELRKAVAALDEIECTTPAAKARVLLARVFLHQVDRDANALLKAVDEAIDLADRTDEGHLKWRARYAAAHVNAFGNPRYFDSLRYLEDARRLANRLGYTYEADRSRLAPAQVLSLRGEYARALKDKLELLERGLMCGDHGRVSDGALNAGTQYVDAGKPRQALPLLALADRLYEGGRFPIGWSRVRSFQAIALATTGQGRAARKALAEAEERARGGVFMAERMFERAQAIAAWEEGKGGTTGMTRLIKSLLDANAPVDASPLLVMAAESGTLPVAEARAALTRLRSWPNAQAEARIRFAVALALEREGDPVAARKELETSSRLAPELLGVEGLSVLRLLMRARLDSDPRHGAEFARQGFHLALSQERFRLAEEAAELAGDLVRKAGNPAGASQWYTEALRVFEDRRREWSEENMASAEFESRRGRLESKAREVSGDGPRDAWLRRLVDLDRELMAEHDIDRLLRRALDAIIELTGAERGFLMLNEDGEWVIRVRRNWEKGDLQGTDFRISMTVAEQVARDGRVFHCADAQHDDRLRDATSVREGRLHSVLCLPLSAGGRRIGILYLDNRHRTGVFDTIDLDVVEMFRDRAGLAIHTARLVADAKRTSRERRDVLREAAAPRKRNTKPPVPLKRHPAFAKLLGSSHVLVEALDVLARAARSDAPVLICGETGTGKELAARGVHDASARARRPFVAVNCAAIAPTLLESELFGHVRGAFTGAERDRLGYFQQAGGGTLFLDEIAEMPPALQAKLLRALQSGEVRRVGAAASERVDVRVVAASNRDLEPLVKQGAFREDLYFRLKGLVVSLPSLRERREDIPRLIDEFLSRLEKKHGKRTIDPAALEVMLDYGWPGNVRELERVIEALVTLSDHVIAADLVRKQLRSDAPVENDTLDIKANLEKTERALLAKAIETTPSLVQAAKKLGIGRSQLYRLMERYDIKPRA